ncbi:hypothetical protein C7456_11513 [Fulvimonas soli]|uniref:Uncharacterized protein n=1 Tax=Fulvimonas soli TaxID=155197 RepID=A0A316HRV9_9GAMM|nr:hypothetical protein C7456_11513 [Fulvimonas soli]
MTDESDSHVAVEGWQAAGAQGGAPADRAAEPDPDWQPL